LREFEETAMTVRREMAAVAAALVADSGLDYGAAKRRAARHLGLADTSPKGAMPDNEEIDEALREHLDLFDAAGHEERRESIQLAAIELMEQLAQWSPLITGAAWKGLVTEHAVLHLQIADGHAKEVAIDLINRGLDFDAAETTGSGGRGRIEVLVGFWRDWPVMIAMHPIHDLRGAARDDGQRGADRGHRDQLIERRRRQWRPEKPQGQARPAFLVGLVILVISLLALAAGLGASWWSRQTVPIVEPAVQTLWSQQWPGADGQPKSLETLRGQITVVNFWATWCAPCVEEMPALSALYQQMNPQMNQQNHQASGSPHPRIEFIGVAIDRADQVAEFARRSPVSYPLVVAGAAGSELGRALGNEAGALPFTAVIDSNGQVVERTLGIVDLEKLRTLLRRMQEGKR
jgi:thiol-disulfide isomerase/thioredoxin